MPISKCFARLHIWTCGWCLVVLLWCGVVQAAPIKRSFYWVESTASALQSIGVPIEKQQGDQAWASVNALQLSRLRQRNVSLIVREAVELPLPAPFKSLTEIEREMADLAARYPKHVTLVNLSQRFQQPKTFEGRALLALRIHAPQAGKGPAPTVLLDSTHHAREVLTPLITLRAARQLAEGYGKDSQITAWVQHYEIWVVPVVNPDGYHYVFTKDPFWRKNRKPNPDNTIGVDLNRNYPYMWGVCGSHSADGKSEIYKGDQPASEPEVQTMLALGKALQPQLYLTYHSYGDEVVRAYVCATAGEEKLLDAVTRELALAAGYKFRKASSSGESFEHFYARFGSLSYLIEVAKAFHPEPAKVPALLEQSGKTWQAFLQRGMGPAILGVVRDATNQEPVQARLSLNEVTFQAQESRQSRADNGFFAWTLQPGTYTLRVQAAGYMTWSQKLTVPADRFLRLNINLQPGTDAQNELTREVTARDGGEFIPEEPRLSERSGPAEPNSLDTHSLDARSLDTHTPESQNHLPPAHSPDLPPITTASTHGCSCQADSSFPTWIWLFGLLLIGWRRGCAIGR